MQGEISQSETRRPPFPNRIIHRERKYSERAVDASILLRCPIWGRHKFYWVDRTDRRIRSDNRAVVEYKIVWQGVKVAKCNEETRNDECGSWV